MSYVKEKIYNCFSCTKTMKGTYNKIPTGWKREKEMIKSLGISNYPLAYMEKEIFYCKKCYTVKRIIK